MNRDELEQWMKDSLGKEDISPGEAGWDKLKAALDAPAGKDRKKALLFLLPRKMRIAASVSLLIAAGSTVYFITRNQETPIAGKARLQGQPLPPAVPGQTNTAPASAHHIVKEEHIAADRVTPTGKEKSTLVLPSMDSMRPDATYVHTPSAEPAQQADSTIKKINVYAQLKTNTPADPGLFDAGTLPGRTGSGPAFNLGIAAQVGKANVGNMRYQLGLVAHQEISEKLYAEATVALASTEVNYTQNSSFASLTVSSGAFNSVVASKSVDAQYGNHILSAGLSPALGYHITPKLALGCGMSLYRNLNPSVSLKNDASIDPAVLNNHLLSETKPVSNWDAGLTGNAAYTIGSKLAVHIQYRHGLSTFMYQDKQAIRNSGINMGFKYLFGK